MLDPGGFMGSFDSFTLAILGGALVVIVIFGLLIALDKGKAPAPPAPSNAPAKAAGGKR